MAARFGAAGVARMAMLAELVTGEAARQNLIAPSTLPSLWARHIVDSAQLIELAADTGGDWLDIGTGAGFPGVVIACLTDRAVTLVEPRRRRAHFLMEVAKALDIAGKTTVLASKVEGVTASAAVISARAVSSLPQLFQSAVHCSRRKTLWILPKGQSAREEIASAEQTWHGVFHVEQSVTDPDSLIVLAKGVSRR